MNGQVQEMTLEDALVEMTKEICGKDVDSVEAITLDAVLADLDMDSLDRMVLFNAMEEDLGNVSFKSKDLGRFATLREAADSLRRDYSEADLNEAVSFYSKRKLIKS